MTIKDLSGTKIGMVSVVNKLRRDSRGEQVWKCECDCGNEFHALNSNLLRKTKKFQKSCGCAKRKHGLHATLAYESWSGMIKRCYSKSNSSYTRYGGRGICVTDRWHDFLNFYEDMGDRSVGMSLDRIDNDGDYEKSNCRWSTASQQARNRSSNRKITANGTTRLVSDWADASGLSVSLITARIDRLGWSESKAVLTPAWE